MVSTDEMLRVHYVNPRVTLRAELMRTTSGNLVDSVVFDDCSFMRPRCVADGGL